MHTELLEYFVLSPPFCLFLSHTTSMYVWKREHNIGSDYNTLGSTIQYKWKKICFFFGCFLKLFYRPYSLSFSLIQNETDWMQLLSMEKNMKHHQHKTADAFDPVKGIFEICIELYRYGYLWAFDRWFISFWHMHRIQDLHSAHRCRKMCMDGETIKMIKNCEANRSHQSPKLMKMYIYK